jgi:hypothetical protein
MSSSRSWSGGHAGVDYHRSKRLSVLGSGGRGVRGFTAVVGLLACMILGVSPVSASTGGLCPNEQVRAETRSTYLPDCRGYELVSPVYKEGHVAITTHVAADGSHVIAESLGAFAGTEDVPNGGGLGGASYEFARTESGWLARGLTPSATLFAEDFSPTGQLVSSDFGTTTWVLNAAGAPSLQRDLYLRMPDGAFVRVGPMTPPTATQAGDNLVLGGSNDLSHVVFSLETNRWPGDATPPGGGHRSLYESILAASDQEPKLVAVKNNGPLGTNTEAELISKCGTEFGRASQPDHGISSNGETVFFIAKACEGAPLANELYARIGGSSTVAISEPVPPRCSSPTCINSERQEASFQGASEDGSKVFFATAQPLLDSDGDTTMDVYEAEITSSGIQQLIQVSKGDSSDPTQGSGARVLEVSAISNDGAHVYFVAEGVLTTAKNEKGQGAVAGRPNLYLAEPATGRTTFIATLASSEAESVRLTPDGRFLVFGSAGELFEYDSQKGVLVRVASEGGGPFVSTDGSYVFFTSSASLVPGALTDPTHRLHNVYEYHNDQVGLISDGRDVFPSFGGEFGARLIGVDASGENVFFETVDPLVSQDTDTQQDIYDARVNGGFPAQPGSSSCQGETCHGAPSAAPAFGVPPSATLSGVVAPPVSEPPLKPTTASRAAKLASAVKACRTKHNAKKRRICESKARKRFGPAHRPKKSNGGTGR